jgi:hypothetical protein
MSPQVVVQFVQRQCAEAVIKGRHLGARLIYIPQSNQSPPIGISSEAIKTWPKRVPPMGRDDSWPDPGPTHHRQTLGKRSPWIIRPAGSLLLTRCRYGRCQTIRGRGGLSTSGTGVPDVSAIGCGTPETKASTEHWYLYAYRLRQDDADGACHAIHRTD